MSETPVTCATVEQQDLEARYVAGQLSAEQAEAFEAHYFGCERCWRALQRALEVRAASAPRGAPAGAPRWSGRRWWPLAAAALVLLAVGVWHNRGDDGALPADTVRGGEQSLTLTATATASGVSASWPRVPNGDVYRLRLFAADGTLLLDRQLAETTLSVAGASLPGAQQTGDLFWSVEALDDVRNVIARSGLVRAQRR